MKDSPSSTNAQMVNLPVADIDLSDRTFEYRLSTDCGDVRKSIEEQGQQIPIVVRGENPPYQIVCGFRRTRAIRELGRDRVLAVIRPHLSDAEAYALAYLENAQRRNLTPLDRANAIWKAYANGNLGTQDEVAKIFGLTRRQIQNYLEMTQFPDPLKQAIRTGKLTSGHALIIHRFAKQDPDCKVEHWIESVARDRLSVQDLRARMRREYAEARSRRPIAYLRTRGRAIIFSGFRFHPERTSREERTRIVADLERAVEILKRGL